MSTDRAVAGLDVLVVAPVPKAVVVELRTAVADQVFRFGADGLNRPTQQGSHGSGSRLPRERGDAHGATRKMIDDDGDPPAEWPTLGQAERQPGNPKTAADRHYGEIDVPDMVGALGRDHSWRRSGSRFLRLDGLGGGLGCGRFVDRPLMRTFFQDATDGTRAEVESGSTEDLGELELPHVGTEHFQPLHEIADEVGIPIDRLADWIASPENPLTARVMANRIWQGHFGRGLVATPSDFGNNGLPPSHTELLDWLAAELIRSGWSVKQMHRVIVLSQTYRQSSQTNSAGIEKDADVRRLWRYPARRLEGEAIRDSMLLVSGRLNLTMYGRGYDLFDKRGGLVGFNPVESFTDDGRRRMIYAHKVRREVDAVFGAFDCPDGGQSTAARPTSTTPIQALNLFNSRFTLDEATAFATRVEREVGDDLRLQIGHAYQLGFSREPSADELSDAEPTVRQFGLAVLCRAIFNSNEFLTLP